MCVCDRGSVCVCTCVCMYTQVCVHVHTSVCTGMCVYVCANLCLCISVCMVLTCSMFKRERGWSILEEGCGLCPPAFGTKSLLLLCMLAVSVGDKVGSC